MSRGFDVPKTPPDAAVRAILDGLERAEDDIFPDPASQSIAEGWRSGALKKSDGAKALKIDVAGKHRLILRVTGGGETQGPQARILADWVNAKMTRR